MPQSGATALIYRGRLKQPLPAPADGAPLICAFPIDALPWEALPEGHICDMLLRYRQERTTDQFGIYAGTVDDGQVATIGGQQPWAAHARTVSGIEPRVTPDP